MITYLDILNFFLSNILEFPLWRSCIPFIHFVLVSFFFFFSHYYALLDSRQRSHVLINIPQLVLGNINRLET